MTSRRKRGLQSCRQYHAREEYNRLSCLGMVLSTTVLKVVIGGEGQTTDRPRDNDKQACF
eukprot:scaffold658_cov184-Alexandrium_tamarense.AAC.9